MPEEYTPDATAADLAGSRWRMARIWGPPLAMLLLAGSAGPLKGPLWSIGLLWIGGACTANSFRCRRVHCTIMGPLFLLLGLMAVGNTLGVLAVPWFWISRVAVAGVAVAYAPEFFGYKYFGQVRTT